MHGLYFRGLSLVIMRVFSPSTVLLLLLCWYAPAVQAQIPSYKVLDTYDDLSTLLNRHEETTLVVNFWATYCAPCVQEIPLLDSLQQKYADRQLKVVLVNLDFRHQLKQRLEPFLEKYHLSSKVVVLADQDADSWIPKVSSDWDGGLPFTMIVKDGKKVPHQQEFNSFDGLEQFVLPHLTPVDLLIAKRKR